MPSAVAEIPSTPLAAVPPLPWSQKLAALDRSTRLRWAAALALVAVGLTAAFFFSRQPDYRVLYSNVSEKDGGAIVAQLAQMNVPYRYTEGGAAILVPAEQVHDVRLRLASLGLPKGSVSGFELMDNSRFGVTQFQERLNYQRGLEGELTRSIEALDVVQGARVHLALPNQNGFFREQQKPSASVLVHLHPGRFLDRTQLAGIVHLVAASVPEMAPQAVSVLDDSGRLLSQTPDGAADTAVDAQQLAYVQQMEQHYIRRIVDILEPVVGKDNVRAQVTADVDFSHTESKVEQHRPNQTPDTAAVRSQQILESGGEKQEQPPAGIPGAVSNQPPQQDASAPINGANPPPVAGSQQAEAKTPAKRESVTNYEVDKTTQVTRGASAAVRRVTAAVVVNATAVAALTPEQMEQMTALVREAIGFQEARGDSVNLMNAPFQMESNDASDVPLWMRPEAIAWAKTWGWPLGLSLAAALLLLGLLRPVLKARAATAAARLAAAQAVQVDAIEGEVLGRPALPAPAKADNMPPTPEQLRLEDARVLAKENPVAVANILQTWVNGE